MEEGRYREIRVTREGGITTVTFNRPERRNAVSPEMHGR